MKNKVTKLIFAGAVVLASCSGKKTPADVNLNSITQDAQGVHISWDQSGDNKFESYKLYRHTTSGLDETTGELIHVGTSVTENYFTDLTFEAAQTYYYRVYVENKHGLSHGSNIESIETQTISLVTNGSFESGGSLPVNWTIIENNINEPLNSIQIDPALASDGSQSLKLHHNTASGCWEQWIEQHVTLGDLTPGGIYEFSFDYRSDAMINSWGMGFTLYNSSIDIAIPFPTFPGDGVWHSFSNQFTLPSNIGSTDPLLRLHFCCQGVIDWWIDNVSVIKVG